MHKLYLLLKPCLPEKEEPYLLDEVEKILENSNGAILRKSIEIIYKDAGKKSAFELLVLFVTGLKDTNFFSYVGFVQGINGKT